MSPETAGDIVIPEASDGMQISLIVAKANNGVIGRGLELPWRLSTDLKRFKALTMGHHVAMGRKTFDSIGKPLPGRTILVISRGRPQLPDGVERATSIEEAIAQARKNGENELFIAGGGEIYRLALPHTDRIYLTEVQAEIEGDVRFPEIDLSSWQRLEQLDIPAGPKDEFATRYSLYERERR